MECSSSSSSTRSSSSSSSGSRGWRWHRRTIRGRRTATAASRHVTFDAARKPILMHVIINQLRLLQIHRRWLVGASASTQHMVRRRGTTQLIVIAVIQSACRCSRRAATASTATVLEECGVVGAIAGITAVIALMI